MKNILTYNKIEAMDEWLGIGDTKYFKREFTPFIYNEEPPGLSEIRVFRNLDYLPYATYVLLGIKLLPFQSAIQEQLWTRPFTMLIASRGGSKSFSLALYLTMRAILVPNTKAVIVGGGFRQAREVFNYCNSFWEQSDILRSIFKEGRNGPKYATDRLILRLGDSTITAIPLGDGKKIRSLRSNITVADEFNTMPVDIYEEVVQGFSTVTQNPVDNVIHNARLDRLLALGKITQESTFSIRSNQNIISGTCGYEFQPLYQYFDKYHKIISSGGNPDEIRKCFSGGEIPEGFDHRDYCIIRIPYKLIPKGMLDAKTIARAKATTKSHIFLHEYAACFSKDSEGFFKRSLIESCTANAKNINTTNWASWCPEPFSARIYGDDHIRYVYGIDPAAELDNLAIVILESHEEHNRVVYTWTTNVENFKERKKRGLTLENNYYRFCARKIRDLMKVFPCSIIGMDGQAGRGLIEALHDPDKLEQGEIPIWETIEEGKYKDTDDQAGLHILKLIQFANATWTSDANHLLKKDLIDKTLLFPQIDSIELAISATQDLIRQKELSKKFNRDVVVYDTLEDCVLEIEELKEEIASIVMTVTGAGRSKWSTPEVKLSSSKKGYLRKDRYSALLIANYLARQMHHVVPEVAYQSLGMIVGEKKENKGGSLYKTGAQMSGFANFRGGIV